MDKERTLFHRLAFISLIAVYVLILVGGIVRSTGSGMGCPDWPKCFGQWVPPTDESELPPDYKEVYSEKRIQKNIKLARYLEAMGFEEKARQVTQDKMVLEEQDFNKFKTLTEYINRLVGVTIGLLVMATFIASIKFYRSEPDLFWMALGILLLTGFQGWIGSLVVSTNLLPWMVTIHMLISFVIVAGIIYLVYRAGTGKAAVFGRRSDLIILLLCMITLVVQVVYGTQVREGIDKVAAMFEFSFRERWIGQLDWQFYFHRSFSWVIFIIHAWLLWRMYRSGERFWGTLLMVVILISIISGALMMYLAIPPVLQPVHLLFACIAFGIQFYLLLLVNKGVKIKLFK